MENKEKWLASAGSLLLIRRVVSNLELGTNVVLVDLCVLQFLRVIGNL